MPDLQSTFTAVAQPEILPLFRDDICIYPETRSSGIPVSATMPHPGGVVPRCRIEAGGDYRQTERKRKL